MRTIKFPESIKPKVLNIGLFMFLVGAICIGNLTSQMICTLLFIFLT